MNASTRGLPRDFEATPHGVSGIVSRTATPTKGAAWPRACQAFPLCLAHPMWSMGQVSHCFATKACKVTFVTRHRHRGSGAPASTHMPFCPEPIRHQTSAKRPPVQGQAWKSAASTFHSQKSRPPDTDRVCGVGGCTQTDRVCTTTWHTQSAKALARLASA